jgi:transcriptional regulator with XRE-family HTH domain
MTKLDLRSIRKMTGLNHTEFWEAIGVTQSGGTRYEQGRRLPKPTAELLRLKYIEKVDLSKIRRVDMDVLAFLKKEQPADYRKLKKLAENHFKDRR